MDMKLYDAIAVCHYIRQYSLFIQIGELTKSNMHVKSYQLTRKINDFL